MRKKTEFWSFNILVIGILLFIDQITKVIAQNTLSDGKEITIIKNIIGLLYLNGGNRGAAFGILSGKTLVFVVFTVIACILLCFFLNNTYKAKCNYSQNPNKKTFSISVIRFMFLFLIAGAIGNLVDRVTLGYVRDFISFKFIDFPIFNVADIYITVSCVIILIICVFKLNNDDFNSIFTLKGAKNGQD